MLQRRPDTLMLLKESGCQAVVAFDGTTNCIATMHMADNTPLNLKWVESHCAGYSLAVARNMRIRAVDGGQQHDAPGK